LITRLSHIGDCVLTLPLACAIKRNCPDAFIAWTVESPTHKLLGDHPCIDEMVVVPKGLARKPFKWSAVKRQLRALNVDIVIDPQSLTKSSFIGKLSGAATRMGFASPYSKELASILNTVFVKAMPEHRHLVDRTLDFLSHELLSMNDRQVEFRMPIVSKDQLAMRRFLREQELSSFLAINPGASWKSKRWVNKRFGYVAQYAGHAFGQKSIVTWAGDEERKMAQEVVDHSDGSAVLAPSTTLGELAALYEQAELFIGCDTGPLHIAAATGTRCVGLYGPTLPENSGAYGADHLAVQSWHQNGRNRKRADNDAMKDITVDDVCVALDKILVVPDSIRKFAA
jgi:ADP-heptose:LPS heptosyltransferase